MALTNEQVREILTTAGVDEEHMKDAAAKIISGHLESVNALRLDVEKYRSDAEKLPGVSQELETLKKSNGDVAAVQKQLEELQKKYDDDTAALKAQLSDRDYADAISKAIAGKGLKFSSKSAQRAFEAALREKKLELKNGELSGLDDFIKAQKEADPEAFTPDKAPPRIVTGSGSGGGHGEPQENVPENVRIAKEMGAARAASASATNDVLKNYL